MRVPVLVLTADATSDTKHQALALGARDFLTKPFDPEEVRLRVSNLLEMRQLQLRVSAHTDELETQVRHRTAELNTARLEVIQRLALAAEYRDDDTHLHAQRIGHTTGLLAAGMGLTSDAVERSRRAAPLHDIGKIAIPDAILCKPGKLTSAEFAVMKTHAALGARLLAGSQSPVLRMAHQIALGHHERWDGSGYPSGLHGTEIPEVARIVAIVDVYDALSHDRIYRPALPESEVLKILRAGRGSHFDPELLDVFMSLLPEMRTIAQTVTDFDEEEPGDDAVEASATDLVLAPAVAAL
jgi:putative two-component system response regulator